MLFVGCPRKHWWFHSWLQEKIELLMMRSTYKWQSKDYIGRIVQDTCRYHPFPDSAPGNAPKLLRTSRSGQNQQVVMSVEDALEIFKEFHNSAIGGHTGINKTNNAISTRFYWPLMKEDITEWVSKDYNAVGLRTKHILDVCDQQVRCRYYGGKYVPGFGPGFGQTPFWIP